MNKIKFGIAGVGRMGSIHLENLVSKFQDAEVVAISDINPNINTLIGIGRCFCSCGFVQ